MNVINTFFKRFQKPNIELEESGAAPKKPEVPDEICVKCPSCKKTLFNSDLGANFNCCTKCGYHFKLSARQRIAQICDEDTFSELFGGMLSSNIIDFPGYDEKLQSARKASGEEDAVIVGTGKIDGIMSALFVMEPNFMMGSMGSVLGEKITLIFEYATENKLPVIGFSVSGGARMQEGIISLMQMAKTSAAVKKHSSTGGLYINILTNPTTGGVTASFATLSDYTFAEPGALIGFAGPRVIEQTIKQKLPERFQTAEFLLEKGFVDAIIERSKQKEIISKFLKMHLNGETV